MQDSTGKHILKILVAILLPPAAVYWQVGFSHHIWINLILWILFWPLGSGHALWLIFRDRYRVVPADSPGAQTAASEDKVAEE